MTAWPTVAVTGHRPKHLPPPAREWVREELTHLAVRLRQRHGMTIGISGMALGADLWWADAVIKSGAALWPHVPYRQQPDLWDPADQQEWARLLGEAGRPPVVYGAHPDTRLLFARNHGMVDACDLLLAVWIRGKRGGTCEALRYAVDCGHRPTWVDPVGRETWWPTVVEWRNILPTRQRRAA